MDDPDFRPGFQFSRLDVIVLAAGLMGSIAAGWQAWWAGTVVGFVVVHFFLFCNVFRIPRAMELLWSAFFVLLAGGTILVNFPGWIATFSISLALSSLLFWRVTRRDDYHGIYWKVFNPRLLDKRGASGGAEGGGRGQA